VGDELQTDLEGLRERLTELEPESVLCVLATTSCFAPRAHDSLPEIARICQEANIPHLGIHTVRKH
jgi:O-phospho-L-seryl-tRNASec:L-selenocysteinyl-tRNA synthase